MNKIFIHMYDSSGYEYAKGEASVPEGVIRWDNKFTEIVRTHLPAEVKRDSMITIIDEEDNTVYFSQCFDRKRTKVLFM